MSDDLYFCPSCDDHRVRRDSDDLGGYEVECTECPCCPCGVPFSAHESPEDPLDQLRPRHLVWHAGQPWSPECLRVMFEELVEYDREQERRRVA